VNRSTQGICPGEVRALVYARALALFFITYGCASAHNNTSTAVQCIIIVVTKLMTMLTVHYVKYHQAAVVEDVVYE
jgi:hypothetical protein